MANRFTRNIQGVTNIHRTPLYTNNLNDLLQDEKDNVYVRVKNGYKLITGIERLEAKIKALSPETQDQSEIFDQLKDELDKLKNQYDQLKETQATKDDYQTLSDRYEALNLKIENLDIPQAKDYDQDIKSIKNQLKTHSPVINQIYKLTNDNGTMIDHEQVDVSNIEQISEDFNIDRDLLINEYNRPIPRFIEELFDILNENIDVSNVNAYDFQNKYLDGRPIIIEDNEIKTMTLDLKDVSTIRNGFTRYPYLHEIKNKPNNIGFEYGDALIFKGIVHAGLGLYIFIPVSNEREVNNIYYSLDGQQWKLLPTEETNKFETDDTTTIGNNFDKLNEFTTGGMYYVTSIPKQNISLSSTAGFLTVYVRNEGNDTLIKQYFNPYNSNKTISRYLYKDKWSDWLE